MRSTTPARLFRRLARSAGLAAALLLLLPALHGHAGEGRFAPFLDESAAPESLPAALDAFADRDTGDDGSTSGGVTVHSPDADGRMRSAERYARMLDDSLAALAILGYQRPANPPPVSIVELTSRERAPVFAVGRASGTILVVESPSGRPASADPPAPLARPDGRLLDRDVVLAAEAMRAWIAAARAPRPRGPGSMRFEIARRAVDSVVPKDSVAPWARDALAAWVETKVAGPDTAEPHVCRRSALGVPALLAAKEPSASPSDVRLLGRAFDALVAGLSDVPARLVRTANPAPGEDPGTAAFGKSLAEACAAAAKGACPCGDKGRIDCPSCAGGKVELACTACDGLGKVICTSCNGNDGCPSGCIGGLFFWTNLDPTYCWFCEGKGTPKCVACATKVAVRCLACSGSGKMTVPCGVCREGTLVCPESGPPESPAAACLACTDPKAVTECPDCTGAGYRGCSECFGTMKLLCSACDGVGKQKRPDGRFNLLSSCGTCLGRPRPCTACAKGKLACETCSGKGRVTRTSGRCTFCGGKGTVPTPAEARAARDRKRTAEELDAHRKVLADALAFLDRSRLRGGAFALREFRKSPAAAGALWEPSIFSNAKITWTLLVAGVGPEKLAEPMRRIRSDAADIAATKDVTEFGTQEVSYVLRALVAAGAPKSDKTVATLIARIVSGQRSNGLWADELDPRKEGDVFNSLFAAETLRAARLAGHKVPGTVWSKLLTGSQALFDRRGPARAKDQFLIGTHVASGAALIVIAKEGTLGKRAAAFDYRSMPSVQGALAWLDRNFAVAPEPTFWKGARVRPTSDRGYSAWLFSVQRLAQLLGVETFAGTRWYDEGSRHLASIQFPDGSFEERGPRPLNGSVRTTSSAVLFLLRATPPVTDEKEGD